MKNEKLIITKNGKINIQQMNSDRKKKNRKKKKLLIIKQFDSV